MPHVYDESRWITNADGTHTRIAGGAPEVNATEGALELAASYGVDLSAVVGTGSGGRITKADVEAYIEDDE
jgi:pyruvate/2-oxoglutarate dehydrogenase complex dihydrolipoamide acyltransferase (E2) component